MGSTTSGDGFSDSMSFLGDFDDLGADFGIGRDLDRLAIVADDPADMRFARGGFHDHRLVLIADDLARIDDRFAQVLEREAPGQLREIRTVEPPSPQSGGRQHKRAAWNIWLPFLKLRAVSWVRA